MALGGPGASLDDKIKSAKEKVDEMKDEFYSVDENEMNLINKEKAEREANEAKIKNNAAKFANLMAQGKKEEAWELLNSLSNEEVSLMFEKLGK